MKIETEYDFGRIVFLKTDCEQEERIVTGVSVRPDNEVRCGN